MWAASLTRMGRVASVLSRPDVLALEGYQLCTDIAIQTLTASAEEGDFGSI